MFIISNTTPSPAKPTKEEINCFSLIPPSSLISSIDLPSMLFFIIINSPLRLFQKSMVVFGTSFADSILNLVSPLTFFFAASTFISVNLLSNIFLILETLLWVLGLISASCEMASSRVEIL